MKGRILTSLLTVIALTGLQAQNIPAVPRLVVGLTIDQLRTDYIEAFSALYGERGFKRLWREGRIYRNAEYDFINVDKSSAVAAIYSGTTPYTNGIVGDNWMDRSTLRVLNCVDDADFMGIYTSESTSPQKMKVSTLTIRRNNNDIQFINIPKFSRFRFRCTGHTRQFMIHTEIVL
jgi:hypothetical protein